MIVKVLVGKVAVKCWLRNANGSPNVMLREQDFMQNVAECFACVVHRSTDVARLELTAVALQRSSSPLVPY